MDFDRKLRLGTLGASALALALATSAALHSADRLKQARQQAAELRQEERHLERQRPSIEQREALARAAEVVRTRVEKDGLVPERWSQRRIQRTTAVVSRQQAELALHQLAGSQSRQWFSPETFSVAVTGPDAGLFTPALPDDKGFSLEMTGVVHFPVGAP